MVERRGMKICREYMCLLCWSGGRCELVSFVMFYFFLEVQWHCWVSQIFLSRGEPVMLMVYR